MITTLIAAAVVAPAITVSKVKSYPTIRATAVATSATGGLFAVASEDLKVRIVNAKSLETRYTLMGHPMTPYAVAFSADGKVLASGDESARIWLWDTKSGKKLREFPREKGHKRGIQALAFSPDGKQLVSVGKDDVIMVWNTSGGNPVKTVPGNGANFYGVRFLSNGNFVTATLSEGMRLYRKGAFDLVSTMKVTSGQGANDVAVNPLGTLGVTAGRDGKVVIWDMKTRQMLGAVLAHSDWVTGVAYAPNGRIVVSSSSDGKLKVLDTKAMKEVAAIDGRAFVDSLVGVTSDGKYLLTTDAANNLQVYQFNPPQK